jgi:hypothetical protein
VLNVAVFLSGKGFAGASALRMICAAAAL